jgi:cellulose synthase/poly-beta-1,6-N-acetylglucosamine synthase-like glycosyltransferase
MHAIAPVASGDAAAPCSLCVVCCAEPDAARMAHGHVAQALAGRSRVAMLSVCESTASADGEHAIAAPPGTKFSKLRYVANRVTTEMVCICDPDLRVAPDGCIAVFDAALAEHRLGKTVVAFGSVQADVAPGLLGELIAIDKWLSHRLLRPTLWRLGVGITLPGQFLIMSTSVLHGLDKRLDTYLDDLYLGFLCRRIEAAVRRETHIVGHEASRTTWTGLIAQRIRWMKGFMQLVWHLAAEPGALPLLAVHFLAYHGLPLIVLAATFAICLKGPLFAICWLTTIAIFLSGAARCSLPAALAYVTVFPLVHLLAVCLWWLPVDRAFLSRR